MLINPTSGACDLFVELFHGLYWFGTMCVGVTLWFGWGGVVSGCRLKLCFSLHPDTTPSTVSAGERPQTYALDRAATGTGKRIYLFSK